MTGFRRCVAVLAVVGAMAMPGAGFAGTDEAEPKPDAAEPIQTAAATTGFDQGYELQGIAFRVRSPNDSMVNVLSIQPSGLELDNTTLTLEIDGSVTNAEIADLDGDGSPEIYVYVTSGGSGSYGSLVAYAVNNGKSVSRIHLPPISEDADNSAGYMGHDGFAVVESTLIRRFPLYLEGDTNASPSGGTRQMQYKLTAGEAGWVLRLDGVSVY
ncbi:MAG: hypothetical protein GY953_10125 [bacterium]|nr:hypothetical protein [bacterium]